MLGNNKEGRKMNENEQMVKEHIEQHICFYKTEKEVIVNEHKMYFYIEIIGSIITISVIRSIEEIGYEFSLCNNRDNKSIAVFNIDK